MKSKNILKPVAFQNNVVTSENLPLPIVHYPGHYGAFFGFKEKNDDPIFLCSCMKEAVENYIKFRLSKPIPDNVDPNRMFVLDCLDFPMELINELILIKKDMGNEVIDYLNFKHKICHECNRIVPEYRYCHEMYGSAFKQNYGWYIKKQSYEFGVEPITFHVIQEICPHEIFELIEFDPLEMTDRIEQLRIKISNEYSFLWQKRTEFDSDFTFTSDLGYSEEMIKKRNFEKEKRIIEINELEKNVLKNRPLLNNELDKLTKSFEKQNRRINKIIENEVRQKFGFKKVGEAWTSETILYYIIRSLFPDKTIIRHYRPEFLQGLELDIYIKELKIGIEYQGIQHYKPIDHWGGLESFNKLKERDKKKKKICESLSIPIIYFKYDEGLNDNIVLKKFQKNI